MRQYDAVSIYGFFGHQGFIYIQLKADKNNFHTWGWTSIKQIGFLGHWGRCPLNFPNLKVPTYSSLYRRLPTINEIFPNQQLHNRSWIILKHMSKGHNNLNKNKFDMKMWLSGKSWVSSWPESNSVAACKYLHASTIEPLFLVIFNVAAPIFVIFVIVNYKIVIVICNF